MADIKHKNSKNVSGSFFVTDPDAPDQGCIQCGLCYGEAPALFGDADGVAYVKKQPVGDGELKLIDSVIAACPVNAIGKA